MSVVGEDRAGIPEELAVDISALASIRALVEKVGTRAGLSEDGVVRLVLSVHELATNVIRHGYGVGRMTIWPTGSGVTCRVSDNGPGMSEMSEPSLDAPEPDAFSGRGLWLIRRMTDRMEIETSRYGTTVTIAVSA